MKLRTGFAVFLLTAAFVFAWSANRYVTGECADLIAGFEDALADETQLCEKALAQCDMWEERQTYFSVLLHHQETDELMQAFLLLRIQAENGRTEETRAALADCVSMLRVLQDGETLRLSNVL